MPCRWQRAGARAARVIWCSSATLRRPCGETLYAPDETVPHAHATAQRAKDHRGWVAFPASQDEEQAGDDAVPPTRRGQRAGWTAAARHLDLPQPRDASESLRRRVLSSLQHPASRASIGARRNRQGCRLRLPGQLRTRPIESATISIQCRTGTGLSARRCSRQPMFAVAITSGPLPVSAAILRLRSSPDSAGCRIE